MSISSALNSAYSGLTAAGRASALVSENIANAMTPGYARRTLEIASQSTTGPGVRVVGVHRHADPAIIANRRVAEAGFAAAQTQATFHGAVADLVGQPDDPESFAMRLADFDQSLIAAASSPESGQRLNLVASSATALAGALSEASDGLVTLRSGSDDAIGTLVERLNTSLSEVQQLNVRITAIGASGGNVAALQDQRQLLVDDINEIIPVNLVRRDHDQIALYSDGGAMLLDGTAATFDFTRTRLILPHMNVQNGLVSGLSLNGIALRTSGDQNAISGGRLAAEFQIRDDLAITAQADLDRSARDLIERFQSPTVDPTLSPGAPGLFTDNGAAFDPTQTVGLAGRLTVNAAVDPTQGGETWRLRDGLGAPGPGPVGDARLLQSLGQALADPRNVAGSVGTGRQTAAQLASEMLSTAGRASVDADRRLGLAAASRAQLTQIELAQGVDTDAELQTLMMVEQAFAANARMIEAVDEMMETLLRL